jgi:hypothetical protein
LVVAGCSAKEPKREAPSEKVVADLPALTAALMGDVRWPDPNHPISDDQQLLAGVYKKRPDLEADFGRLPIKIWHDSRDVFVAVCSPDGTSCWLEDASWTPGIIDRKCYLLATPEPCPVTLTPPLRPTTEPASRPWNTSQSKASSQPGG